MLAGMTAGTTRRTRKVAPTALVTVAALTVAPIAKIVITGLIMKMSGSTAIAPMMNGVRRYSRISFRATATSRLPSSPIIALPPGSRRRRGQ